MASTILVGDNTGFQPDSSLRATGCYTVIGFKNFLPSASVSGANADAEYPLLNAFDQKDETKYSPANSTGSVTILFNFGANAQEIDYFAYGFHNGISAGLSIKVEYLTGGSFVTATETSGTANDRPYLYHFEPVTTNQVRITLNFTSKLYIGALYVGKAMVFERTPNIGFNPARFNPLDEATVSNTQGGNFVIGRRLPRGFGERGEISLINVTPAYRNEVLEYNENALNSNLVFVKWHQKLDDVILGRQDPKALNGLPYNSSVLTSFIWDVKGYA